jgi:ATP-dependent RNA helicase DeaD
MNNFAEIGLHEEILDAIRELGFVEPTPIQAKTIPHLLTSDQDLLGFAQTGTGKTAAFGLPSLHLTDIKNRLTQTLILCPTRELCIQITKDLQNFAKFLKGLNVVSVYGGASIDTQIRALKKGAQVVVGTPGRTRDLIKRGKLDVTYIDRVILDEADEMLTMGFKEELDSILENTPPVKQTLLFSATMSKDILGIAHKYMNEPTEISVAAKNTASENVNHVYYMVHAKHKYEVLKRIADINPNIYGIVFCRTRRETKEIAAKFMEDGYNADALHGDLSQAQRDEVMNLFRIRNLQILVATDVAARGLDVNDLTHIINFNLPDDGEIYVHRSGRTGRAGKEGTSIAIIHTRETRKIKDIERRFGINFTKEPVPTGRDICNKQLLALIDKIEKVEVDEAQIAPFMDDIYEKLEWLDREALIKHFVSAEFNRFLAYYKNSRDINVEERKKREKGEKGERKTRSERRKTPFKRLYINVGEKNRLTPPRLIGLINDALDSGDAVIGKIEILKKFSFFEIEESVTTKLINEMQKKEFDNVQLLTEISKEKPKGAKEYDSRRNNYGGKRDGRDNNRNNRSKKRGKPDSRSKRRR